MIVKFVRVGKRETEHASECLGYQSVEFDTDQIHATVEDGQFRIGVPCLCVGSSEVPHHTRNAMSDILADYDNGFIALAPVPV